jgi:hypothetical protein
LCGTFEEMQIIKEVFLDINNFSHIISFKNGAKVVWNPLKFHPIDHFCSILKTVFFCLGSFRNISKTNKISFAPYEGQEVGKCVINIHSILFIVGVGSIYRLIVNCY